MDPKTTTATEPAKPGVGSKFKFFTGPVKAFTRKNAETGKDEMFIAGAASSNVRDRYGDTMSAQCQASMLTQAKGLTMFGNHDYDVPEDVFGKCATSQLSTESDIIDLDIEMQIAQSNPRAVKSWELINKDGVTLAFSIGGIILEAEIDEDNDDGSSWWPPLIINDLELLEISLVGIPANPRAYTRSFIEDIKKSAFKGASRDPGVTKAYLRSIGVKGVDEEFPDLREAEIANAAAAATAGAVETAVEPIETPAVEGTVAIASGPILLERDGVNADGSKTAVQCAHETPCSTYAAHIAQGEADAIVATARTNVEASQTELSALNAEIVTKTAERDALVATVAELEVKKTELAATPTGRQTQAHAGGSSNTKPLSQMTSAELLAHKRALDGAQSDDARPLGAEHATQ